MKDILEKENSSVLVSHYVPNPFLIDGIKFDLRYVLVTSYDPLRIYIHQEGLGRFATEKYVKSSKNFSDKFMHLTNYSVNKTNINFIQNADADVDNVGSKWSLSAVKEHLSSVGVDIKKLMESIRSIVVKTIMSVQPYISSKFNDQVPFRHNCFELYGFDVLIDENLTPWLLEVNLSPSLSTDSPLDLKIKSSVICDLLNMVGIFNTQPTTSFPTKQKLPFPESGQPTQSPYLDFVSDEFSFRGGFELAFPARDWETYLPFLERNENTRFYPAIVERLFGGLRRARNPKVKKRSLRNSTGRRSLSPQKEKPKEKEKEQEKEKEKEEKEKEKDLSRNLLQKSSNLNVGPVLRRELSKTLLSSSPSLHSHPLSVSINSRSLQNSKSSQSSPSPTFNSSLSPSIPFPSSPILPTSPTSPTLLRAARSSFKNLNLNTTESPTDYVIPLAPTTYSPFRVAPRDIFGNIVAPNADSNTIEEKQTPKPKTPPLLNPHNETLLKLLESKLEEDTNKTTRNHFQDIELQPIHAREIFTVYLQHLASRLSLLSQKTVYDQFYSTSSHIDFQKFNFSEISDNIQLVHLVEKFLNSTSSFVPANSSFSPLSVPRAPTPLSRSSTPAGNTGENVINTGKHPLRRSLSSGKKEEFSNILLSQKAAQVLRSLETYITNYKLQTNTFKKKHHFNSNNDKETEWVEWERFVQLLNGYSDKDLESLISRFGEGENHIYLPVV